MHRFHHHMLGNDVNRDWAQISNCPTLSLLDQNPPAPQILPTRDSLPAPGLTQWMVTQDCFLPANGTSFFSRLRPTPIFGISIGLVSVSPIPAPILPICVPMSLLYNKSRAPCSVYTLYKQIKRHSRRIIKCRLAKHHSHWDHKLCTAGCSHVKQHLTLQLAYDCSVSSYTLNAGLCQQSAHTAGARPCSSSDWTWTCIWFS